MNYFDIRDRLYSNFTHRTCRVLSKGQLHDLWKALSSNEVIGFEKLTEFLTKVSQEIKRSQTQAVNVEQALKGYVRFCLKNRHNFTINVYG